MRERERSPPSLLSNRRHPVACNPQGKARATRLRERDSASTPAHSPSGSARGLVSQADGRLGGIDRRPPPTSNAEPSPASPRGLSSRGSLDRRHLDGDDSRTPRREAQSQTPRREAHSPSPPSRQLLPILHRKPQNNQIIQSPRDDGR
jgi:hypothetical protein